MDLLYIILPALIAGISVSLSHAALGREVLKRGIIFIDLAIAQIAAVGIIISRTYMHHEEELILGFLKLDQIFAFIFAISAAYFFMSIEKTSRNIQEAVIGCSFIVSVSVAILLVAHDPHGGAQIEAVLSGQILWASWKDIIAMAIASASALLIWSRCDKERKKRFFYPLFAICVTFSVQLVGVYLVFASLIFPAIATFKLSKNRLFWAYIVSILSYAIGIIVSYYMDFPTSPVVIISFVLVVVVFLALASKFKMIRN